MQQEIQKLIDHKKGSNVTSRDRRDEIRHSGPMTITGLNISDCSIIAIDLLPARASEQGNVIGLAIYIYTVFPRIVSAESILFRSCQLRLLNEGGY